MDRFVKKTTIITGYSCNNRCSFCIYADRHGIKDKTTGRIIEEMASAKKRGNTWLVFVGGEIFIRKDIAKLISRARGMGFTEVVAATNGRMFAYKNFAKEMIEAGITQIYFSIHGHTPLIHDSLTRAKGSFKQQLSGIKNLYSLGFKKIGTHTTIVRKNYRFLPQITKLISDLGIKSMDFVFVDPNYGGAKYLFKELVPRISLTAPYIKKSLDILKTGNAEHYGIRYFPICRLNGYEEYVSDIKDLKKVHTEHIGPEFNDYHVEMTRRKFLRIKTKRCVTCLYFNDCEGVWKEYIKRYGDHELSPIKCRKA